LSVAIAELLPLDSVLRGQAVRFAEQLTVNLTGHADRTQIEVALFFARVVPTRPQYGLIEARLALEAAEHGLADDTTRISPQLAVPFGEEADGVPLIACHVGEVNLTIDVLIWRRVHARQLHATVAPTGLPRAAQRYIRCDLVGEENGVFLINSVDRFAALGGRLLHVHDLLSHIRLVL